MKGSKINFENKNFVCNFEQKIAIIIYIVAEIVKKIEESQDVELLSRLHKEILQLQKVNSFLQQENNDRRKEIVAVS